LFESYVVSLSDHVPLALLLQDRERRLHILKKKGRFDITRLFRLCFLLRRLKIDIVHGFLFHGEIAARIAGFMAGTKIVIGSERNSQHNYKKIQYLTYNLTKKLVHTCIANSKAGLEFNRNLFNLPEAKYRVVYNGVDTNRFRPRDDISLRQEIGIPEDCFVLGMFASLKVQKNHPYLLKTIARLLERRTDFRLLLIGDAIFAGGCESKSYSESVLQMIDDLNLRSYCLFLGRRDDVELLYNLCDLTLLPSLYEGTPNVALESLACGVPVIATDVSDNRYVIPDNKVGYIVSLDDHVAFSDKIDSLLTDELLRSKFKANARKWILEKFSIDKMVSGLAKIYSEALTGSWPGTPST